MIRKYYSDKVLYSWFTNKEIINTLKEARNYDGYFWISKISNRLSEKEQSDLKIFTSLYGLSYSHYITKSGKDRYTIYNSPITKY